MSPIPTTESIGKTRWMQGEDNEAFVEIRIPATLPEGVRPRNLVVELKDGDVLCVSHHDTKILQWRLFAQVNNEIEWRIEDDTTLVVDLEKRNPVTWSCLLNLPMKENDELFTPFEEINNMFAAHLPCLPPIDVTESGREENKVQLPENNNNNNNDSSNQEEEKEAVEKMKKWLSEEQEKKEVHDEQEQLSKPEDKQIKKKEDQTKEINEMKKEADGTNKQDCMTDSVALIEGELESTSENSNNKNTEENVTDDVNNDHIMNGTKDNSQMQSSNKENQKSTNQNGSKSLLQEEEEEEEEEESTKKKKEQEEKEEEAKIVEAVIPDEVVCTEQVIKPIGLQDEKVDEVSSSRKDSEKSVEESKKKENANVKDVTIATTITATTDDNDDKENNNDNEEEDDDDKEMEETFTEYIKSELANYELEESEITKKLNEVELELANGVVENEILTTAQKKKDILEEMLRIHNQLRELRTRPYTLDSFLQATELDLHKARVNLGEWNDENTEEYADESERALTATELMARGLEELQEQNITSTIHYLRLAAIHHKHEESTLLLYAVCSRCGLPGGATLLFRRALDKLNPSAACNHKLGELYDQGARYFMPVFPAAIYFYERAAKLGSVNAMLALAQLWCRGATASSLLTEKRAEALIDTRKYHGWLDKAVDRGSGSAYFVKGCLHLHGEHGVQRSYELAKDYFDAARKALPEIMRRTQVVLPLLEQLRIEEEKKQEQQQNTLQGEESSNSATANRSLQEVNQTKSTHNGSTSVKKLGNDKSINAPKTVANGARSTKVNAASHASSTIGVATKNKITNNVVKHNNNDEEASDDAVVDDDEDEDVEAGQTRNLLMTASKARLNALTNRGSEVATKQASRTAPVRRARKGGMLSSSSAARKAIWERVCVTSLTLYGLYAILFPIRVIMLPYFYSFISGFVESIPWLANSNADLSAFY